MKLVTPSVVQSIIDAKSASGSNGYLWLHSSGDCILWPSKDDCDEEDNESALDRWELTDAQADELRASGEVDDEG